MAPRAAGPGYQELTDPENAEINATRTPRFWKKGAVYSVRSGLISLDFDPKAMQERLIEWGQGPGKLLLSTAIKSSGSIKGEHRRDLKEAVIGAPNAGGGLSVNVGSDGERAAKAKPERGL